MNWKSVFFICSSSLSVVPMSFATDLQKVASIEISPISASASASTRDLSVPGEKDILHVEKKPLLTISDFNHANVSDANGHTILNLSLTEAGSARLRTFSDNHVGRKIGFLADGKLLKAPIIKVPISGNGVSIGPMAKDAANRIADTINNKGPDQN